MAAGRIADLLGRKRLFESGIVVFTIASGLCALARAALERVPEPLLS